MSSDRTSFDKAGYAIVAVAWAVFILFTVQDGAAVMGERIAYLAVGSGLFMIFWMGLGWVLKKIQRRA